MSMTQAVVIYIIMFFVLLLALVVCIWRAKPNWQKIWCYVDWREIVARKDKSAEDGEFWFKISLAAFIALSSGLALVTFVLPYGVGWVLTGLFASLLVLAIVLPYLLA
jgi:hypothetical protein